jgi:hypothetical protein
MQHHHTLSFHILEHEFFAAFAAQPEMLHRMRVWRRLSWQMGFMEPEKSAFAIVESYAAFRIRACGEHDFSRGSFRQTSKPANPCLYVNFKRNFIVLASCFLFFQSLDGAPEPLPECRLQFPLRSRPVERVDRSSTVIQRNIAARNISIAGIFRCQLREQAIAGGLGGLRWIKIQAARRVLEYELVSRSRLSLVIGNYPTQAWLRPRRAK